jgi:hypothetical protein
MTEEEKLLNGWKEANKKLITGMFSGELLKTCSKKEIEDYFKLLVTIYSQQSKRYLYAHSTLTNVIGNYFDLLGWNYGFEIPQGDLNSNYRFDLMAQNGNNIIVVEVKPEITTQDLGQVLGYVYDIRKKYPTSRLFIGTDILNLPLLGNDGEIKDIINDSAKNLNVGIIFATKDQAWFIPAEFIY